MSAVGEITASPTGEWKLTPERVPMSPYRPIERTASSAHWGENAVIRVTRPSS